MTDESVRDHHETIADIIDDSKSFLQETQRALNNLRPKPTPLQQQETTGVKKYASDDEEEDEEENDSDSGAAVVASVKTHPRACTKLKRSYQLEYSSDESDEYDSLVQKNITLSNKQNSLNQQLLQKSSQQQQQRGKSKSSNTSSQNNVNSSQSEAESEDESRSSSKTQQTQQRRKDKANAKTAAATQRKAHSVAEENLSDSSASNSDDSNNSSSDDDEEDEDEDEDDDDEYEEDEEDEEEDEEEDDDDDDDDSDYSNSFPFKKVKKKKKKNKSSSSLTSSSRNKKKPSSSSSSRALQHHKTPPPRKASSSSKNSSAPHSKRTTTSKTINYCEESDEDESYSEEAAKPSRKEQAAAAAAAASEPPLASTSSSNANADEANIETIEKVLKHRMGRVGATGSKTAIYNVEETGDPNKAPSDGTTTVIYEDQYLIKWQNWAHLHNTWESRESLLNQKAKGFKKLENFLKKQEEIRAWKADASSPEDVEFYECQMEMLDNLLESHTNVERIVSSNKVRNAAAAANGLYVTDYLCKWEGLPYSDCTWEDGELITKRFAQLVADYERRQTIQTLPPLNVKAQKVLKMRPRFVALKEKPAYLGGGQPDLKLRDYQLDGLNWLAHSWCKQNSIILADEMGLGKTIQTISFISYVFNEHNLFGPFLIVIPLSTIQGWQREFEKWAPEINFIVYLGDINSRNMIQKYELTHPNKRFKCNAILTTYEILLKDKTFFNSISWAVLLVDEAHRLKNEDSLLYRTLINFDTNHRLLITGTPLQNSLKELWALVHFIMPDRFDCWEEFDRKYSSVLSDGQRFAELHRELQPYLLRRVKKDVEKSLPSKVEQILRVEMTNVQKNYYKLILTKNYKELAKGAKGSVGSFLNIMMELKKCSNHVYLIRRDDDNYNNLERLLKGSGKLLLLDKLLRRLKETGHRVLIFSQMVRMLDIIAEYLQYRRFPFQRLDGSIKGEIRRQALDHFNKPDSEDFCFLLSTRAGGLGINLATADTVIIYDSDWNPQNDLQAQARAHRIGQKNQVNIYRLVSKNSIEEDIVERAKQKIVLDHLVIQRMDTTGRTVLNNVNSSSNSSNPFSKEEINSILKFGAEELFKEKDGGGGAASGTAIKDAAAENEEELQHIYDIDEILKRAETRADEETNHMSASDELLSQFKVANFSTMEDDPILPSSMNTTPRPAKAQLLTTTGDPTLPSSSSLGGLAEKSWDDIIPFDERQRIELENEEEQLRQINLASTSRRNRVTNLKDQYVEDDELDEKAAATTTKKSSSSSKKQLKKSSRNKDSSAAAAANESLIEYDDGSQLEVLYEENDGTEEGEVADDSASASHRRYQTIKRSMDKSNVHFVIRGLNTQEVRRFIRSFKKFPCPLLRIDTIAQDAQLEEKSQAFLIDFATKMKDLFTMACKAYDERYLESNGEGKLNKKRVRGPNIVLNGIKLNARQILDAEKYFQPLADYFASTEDKKFKSKLKQPYWDCEWTQEDDWALLKGIYEYGYGNWELIKADASLNLSDKILRTETKTLKKTSGAEKSASKSTATAAMPQGMKTNLVKLKPQSKHLKTRVAYLMKVLASQIYAEKYGADWKSIIKKTTAEQNDDQNSNLDSHDTTSKSESMSRKFKRKMLPWSNEYESSSDTNQKESSAAAAKSKRARKSHHHDHDSNESDQSEPSSKPTRKGTSSFSRQSKTTDDHHHHHHQSGGAGPSNSSANNSNHHHHHHHHHGNSNNASQRNDENNNDHHDNEQQHSTTNSRSRASRDQGAAESNGGATNNNNKKEKKVILSEKVFNECKNLMRPVKKALKNIDIKEINMTERDEIDKMKKHLLEIGDQINDELSKYSDPDKAREWRNYLWVFVSKFSTWNPERLRNLYKKFASKRNEEELESSSSSKPTNMNSPYDKPKPTASSSSSYLKRHDYDEKPASSSSYYRDDEASSSSRSNKYSNMSPPPSRSKKSSSAHFKSNREMNDGYDSPSLSNRSSQQLQDDDAKHGGGGGGGGGYFEYNDYYNNNPHHHSSKQQPPQQFNHMSSAKNPPPSNFYHGQHHSQQQHHHSHYQQSNPTQQSYNLSYGGQQQPQNQQYHHNYGGHGYNSGANFYYGGHDTDSGPVGNYGNQPPPLPRRSYVGGANNYSDPSDRQDPSSAAGGNSSSSKSAKDSTSDKLKAKLKN